MEKKVIQKEEDERIKKNLCFKLLPNTDEDKVII